MKSLFVYDSLELAEVGRIINAITPSDHIHVLTVNGQEKGNLYDVAEEIKGRAPENEPYIIFIDQYLDCADIDFKLLQSNAGIALIKFLRIMNVRHHIVLITPFSGNQIELVKQSPGNLIVTSKGISFAQNLYEFKDKSLEELNKLAENTFEGQDLTPYILTEFRLPEDERHNWANWWGIIQLTDVHRNLFPHELNNRANQYSTDIDNELKSLKSVQALQLFHHNVDFKKAVDKAALEKLSKQKIILANEIDKLKKRISGTGKKNPKPDDWTDFIFDREKIISENVSVKGFNKQIFDSQIEVARAALELGKCDLGKKEIEFKEIETTISNFTDKTFDVSDNFKNEISKFRFSGKNKCRIIYVDDNAGKGWSEMFQILIYGSKQTDNIFKWIDDTDKHIDTLYEEIKTQISKIDPHLVLLDLRLKNESGTYLNVEEISGTNILRKIREGFPGLPVMMTTASNKVWSYQTLLNLGADAYWMKEGIDVSASLSVMERANYSIDNYRNFLRMINALSGDKYQFLKKYSLDISEIVRDSAQWWLNPEWCNHATDTYRKELQVDAKVITQILYDTLIIIRDYLRMEFIQSEHEKVLNIWMYPTLIIQNLAKIIEYIHGVTQTGIPTTHYIKETRGDVDAGELLRIRGYASHYNDAKNVDYESVKDFTVRLVMYLQKKPEFRVGLNVVSKN
jgi:CheY-like chemotaxis protein